MCTKRVVRTHEERSEEIKKKKTQHPRGKKRDKGDPHREKKKKKKASRALPQSLSVSLCRSPLFVRFFSFLFNRGTHHHMKKSLSM